MKKAKLTTKAAKAPKAPEDNPKAAEDNIEAIARDLCKRQLLGMSIVAADAAVGVDRYWPIMAAEIEAGLIDTAGNRLAPFDIETSQAAYRDWVQRHA